MLNLDNINLYIKDKVLFKGLNLTINEGEIHVLMGRNGIGKSSIAKTILGDQNYKVEGHIYYNGEDITNLNIYERSRRGIYTISQMPMEIEGVTNAEMLRTVISNRTTEPLNILKFNKELESICASLELDKSFIHREINVGASGGEKKKVELMHMWMLKPSFIILDEIDSGLDVDAIKLVATSLKKYYEEYHPSILIITHSSTLIDTFSDYHVHLLDKEGIIMEGNQDLAHEILTKGYKNIIKNEHLL